MLVRDANARARELSAQVPDDGQQVQRRDDTNNIPPASGAHHKQPMQAAAEHLIGDSISRRVCLDAEERGHHDVAHRGVGRLQVVRQGSGRVEEVTMLVKRGRCLLRVAC